MEIFQSAKSFLTKFDFSGDVYLGEPTILIDWSVGFSVKLRYPDDILFRPARAKNGQDDSVALIHIIYAVTGTEEKIDPQKVPIIVSAYRHSRYLADHVDYSDDDDSPSSASLAEMRASIKPWDFRSDDQFFYNHSKDRFFDESGREFSGNEFIDQVFELHLGPTRPVKGLIRRQRLRAKSLVRIIMSWPERLIVFILRWFFGRTLTQSSNSFSYLRGYKWSDLKLISENSLTILGYKASKPAVLMLGSFLFVFGLCRALRFLDYDFVNRLPTNNLFSLGFVITALWVLDGPIVWFWFYLLNLMIRLRVSLMLRL